MGDIYQPLAIDSYLIIWMKSSVPISSRYKTPNEHCFVLLGPIAGQTSYSKLRRKKKPSSHLL